MNREQKAQVIDQLKGNFSKTESSFLVEYKGLTVAQMQNLRNGLREKGGALKVAKARLMKRAVSGIEGVDALAPHFKEQIGVVFAYEDTSAVAKVLRDFAKDNEALNIVAGYFDTQILDNQAILRIASLPSKDVLLAQLCAQLNAPVSSFTRVLNMLILRLLFVLKQVGEKKQ